MPIVAFSILTGTCMALSYIQSIFTNMLKHNLIQKCLAGVSEKAMAPHSSTLAWKIPWTEEPGGLQSMGS